MRCLIHTWGKTKETQCICMRCKKTRHTWDGCVCSRCGETRHNWNHCTCIICGSIRDEHYWNHCTCMVCGKIRNEHNWHPVNNANCEGRCSVCGRIEPIEGHDWKYSPKGKYCEGTCLRCGVVEQFEHVLKAPIVRDLYGNVKEYVTLCSCERCGAINKDRGNRNVRHAGWEPVPGTGKDRCIACGDERDHHCYLLGLFEHIDGCRKKCIGCGTLFFDHDYQIVKTWDVSLPNYDYGGQYTETYKEYECSKCGHGYTSPGYTYAESGKVE